MCSSGLKESPNVFQGGSVCSVGGVCAGYISWTCLYEGQAEVGAAEASRAVVIMSGHIQVRHCRLIHTY